MQNAIHDPANWASVAMDDGEHYVMFQHAPIDEDGEMYPPINRAALSVLSSLLTRENKKSPAGPLELGRCWEVLNRYYAGEYEECEKSTFVAQHLAWSFHQHLGNDLYTAFLQVDATPEAEDSVASDDDE